MILASAYDPYYQHVAGLIELIATALYLIGDSLFVSLMIVFVLVAWFETNAFVEYARIFGARLEGYKKLEETGILFVDWLPIKYDNFLVRLITCPICLVTWLSIVGAYFFCKNVHSFFIIFYMSLMAYFLFKIAMKKADS